MQNNTTPQLATTPGKDLLTRPAQLLGFTIDADELVRREFEVWKARFFSVTPNC